jgi:hypothetical protein
MSHVGVDLPHQFPDVAERAAANRLLSDQAEPALDLVEPVWSRSACNECDSADDVPARL